MLLVAQRVMSTRHRVQGVNTYRYRHGSGSWPADPRVMLDDPSKTLERKDVHLRPGGNRVVSFLDVAAPDGVLLGELLDRLNELKSQAPPLEFPLERVLGPCAVRFAVEGRILPFWRGELEDLIQHLMVVIT
ncbi:MAG: hypothetical protein HY721_24340 [Planctomycetes bacterium]|nr:hypothetical protein [Planctomycetota bacterium]